MKVDSKKDAWSDKECAEVLKHYKLRVTQPRLAIVKGLSSSFLPLAHSELIKRLDGVVPDEATVYRNLIKLREVGLVTVVSRAGGMDRYILVGSEDEREHVHPHFACERCGQVSCLPGSVNVQVRVSREAGQWQQSMQEASLQFSGVCPTCSGN